MLLNIVLLCVLLMVWQPIMSSHRNRSYRGKEIYQERVKRNSLSQYFYSFFEDPRQSVSNTSLTIIDMTPDFLNNDQQYLNSLEYKIYPDFKSCYSKPVTQEYYQKGDYWALENYIPMEGNFTCNESITYATHADFTFLENLEQLTARWKGPVSVAVYSPGTDFPAAIETILYLRNCKAESIKKLVSFHLFFHVNHVPKEIPTTDNLLQRKIECGKDPPNWSNVTTYRQQRKMLYPVNVARNVARAGSVTYFNFPSDIELYPSSNVIQDFFEMLKKPDASKSKNPRVYAFPIFEIADDQQVPETKAELQVLLRKNLAIPFHKFVCPECHTQPKAREWQKAKTSTGLSVFHISKRKPPFFKWEPIYIGTNKEPLYDERLTWEGKSDKMTQMYIMCVRDYEFHILDNAFLVHKPGIKKIELPRMNDMPVARQNYIIRYKIYPEYRTIFGTRKNCII